MFASAEKISTKEVKQNMGTQNEVFDAEVMGEQLKKLRKKVKLSQEKFAERMGMSKDTIYNYEKGKTAIPHDLIKRLCQEFNVSADYFYFETDKPLVEDNTISITDAFDKDTFYKTRERMEHIKKKHLEASKPKADVPKKPDNILVYKTKCACCGGSVLIGRHHTYSDKFYYKCKNRRKLARLCDNKYSYDYSEVMDSVFSVIRQHMSLCVEKTKFVQKMNSRKENVLQYDIYTKQIAKLQNDVRRITANKSGLYEDYREQLITAEELCQYQKEYECRVNEIEAQITELLHRRSLYEKEFHIDEGWEETVNKYMTKRKLTKELVDAFVSEIVFNDGNIEVKLLYDDFLKELLEVAEEREVSSNG